MFKRAETSLQVLYLTVSRHTSANTGYAVLRFIINNNNNSNLLILKSIILCINQRKKKNDTDVFVDIVVKNVTRCKSYDEY